MSNVSAQAGAALKKSTGLIAGFKEFIQRGNAIDLAVGVVIGAAFATVVDSIVGGILEPLIGAIFGKPNFNEVWTLTLNGTNIQPFVVVTALVNFLLVAAAIYFFVVVPMNALAARRKVEEPDPEDQSEEAVLLTEIRDLLAKRQ